MDLGTHAPAFSLMSWLGWIIRNCHREVEALHDECRTKCGRCV